MIYQNFVKTLNYKTIIKFKSKLGPEILIIAFEFYFEPHEKECSDRKA